MILSVTGKYLIRQGELNLTILEDTQQLLWKKSTLWQPQERFQHKHKSNGARRTEYSNRAQEKKGLRNKNKELEVSLS